MSRKKKAPIVKKGHPWALESGASLAVARGSVSLTVKNTSAAPIFIRLGSRSISWSL